MPAPMNFIDREFAPDTRAPAASFSRAMADMYEAFALIEDRLNAQATQKLMDAGVKLSNAIEQMEGLHSIEERWDIRDPNIFPHLLRRLTDLTDTVPNGDRALVDYLIAESHALKATISEAAHMSPDGPAGQPMTFPGDDEGQVQLIHRILNRAIRLQQVAMLATQISMVTTHAPRDR